MKRLLLLANGGNIKPSVNMVFDDGRVETRNFNIRLGKNVPILSKKSLVRKDFFRACNVEDDVFINAWFDGNFHLDDRGNIGHVPFFKIIKGMDFIFEPICVPKRNEFFILNHIKISVNGRLERILR